MTVLLLIAWAVTATCFFLGGCRYGFEKGVEEGARIAKIYEENPAKLDCEYCNGKSEF